MKVEIFYQWGNFFRLPVCHGSNAMNKSKSSWMGYTFASKKLELKTYMKELKFEFLEKSELQHHRDMLIIAIFGYPWMWASKNYLLQPFLFWSNFVYFDPRETKRTKNTASKKLIKKFQFFSFTVELWKTVIFVSAFLENQIFFSFFED